MLSKMEPAYWVPAGARSLLDVGCNAGDLLVNLRHAYPEMRLVGVDVNAAQIEAARARLLDIEFHLATGTALPFPDEEFDCVTCIEVLEHIAPEQREAALREIYRVLRPGGRLVLRVPHAGLFAWMDSNNLRFRFPRVYHALLGKGRRDEGYAEGSAAVVWHHHFTKAELMGLLGSGWSLEGERRGALFLLPLVDIACWPLYRLRRIHNRIFRTLQGIAALDMSRDYGALSYDILLALRRD
jgi:SAM-dependent methyltransferase